MARVPRRPKNTKAPLPPAAPPAPPEAPDPPDEAPRPKLSPVDELEARLREPDEGHFMHALDDRTVYPTLIEKLDDAGQRIITVLRASDSAELWPWYEELEADLAFVRERAAFNLGWQHGSADGRAEFFRSQAPALKKKAKRLADQARALVVNGGLSSAEATALLLETAWALVLERPAPNFAE